MGFIKRFLTICGIFLGLFLILFLSFYFWGSSNPLSEKEYRQGIIWKTSKVTEKKQRTYSLIAYNVGFASGLANNRAVKTDKAFYGKNLSKIISVIEKKKPVFAALQEIDSDSSRSYHINQIKAIATQIPFARGAYLANHSKRYVPFPYWPPSVHYRRVISGQTVLSNYEIISQKRHLLNPPPGKPFYWNAFYLKRIFQEVHIDIEGEELVIINLHLEAWDIPNREEQAQQLLEVYRSLKDRPVIIAGDFNCPPPWATRMKDFPNDPDNDDYTTDKTMKIILAEPTLKLAISRGQYLKNEKSNFTYSSGTPSRKIDHILYNDKIEAVKASVLKNAGTGSDHLPLYFEFKIKRK